MTRFAILLLLAAVIAALVRVARDVPVLASWLSIIGVAVLCAAAVAAGKALLGLALGTAPEED